MTGRSFASVPENPAVAIVEAILQGAARHVTTPSTALEKRPGATHALSICACVTLDSAPRWLIYQTMAGDVAWCRLSDGTQDYDLVDARLTAGGHADPGAVLAWLQGAAPDPWHGGGEEWGDNSVVVQLAHKLRDSSSS